MTLLHRSAKAIFALIVGIVILGAVFAGAAAALPGGPLAPQICPPPAAPSSFWGYVTLNGAPAPAGLKLAARVGGLEVASTTTQPAGGATYYLIDVPARAYDSVTGQVCQQGGAAGEMVSFVLCGVLTANETGMWNGGSLVQHDLAINGSCQGLTATPTATGTATATSTATSTSTATPTPTPTPTETPTATLTATITRTPTRTPTVTPTATTSAPVTNTPTATATPCIAYDWDQDGEVTVADVLMMVPAWNSKPGDANWIPQYDVDLDGMISVMDLMIVVDHIGDRCPQDLRGV